MDLLEKEWFIEAPWGRLCVVAWGECSDPPVLLCHGVVDSAASFRPLLRLLPKKFYYVAIELPGNGRSDPYPPGLMISSYDLVYTLAVVVRHFRWQKFDFIAHSLGTVLGFLYDLSYPGMMTKVVMLDPVTKALTVPPNLFAHWYHTFFTKYYEKFDTFNAPKEHGPKYEWNELVKKVQQKRGLSEANAVATLHRMSEPAGDGMFRYTFDQRMKLVTRPPLSPENLKKVLTTPQTPTLAILAEESIDGGRYAGTPFLFDEGQYPNRNYRVRRVNGHHDVHFENPERLAGYVSHFLLYGLKGFDAIAKL